jgi:hypothetical protein
MVGDANPAGRKQQGNIFRVTAGAGSGLTSVPALNVGGGQRAGASIAAMPATPSSWSASPPSPRPSRPCPVQPRQMTASIRQATAADLPRVREIISAAYGMYVSRMDRPPAPMLRDYAVEDGTLWVAGTPVMGLISLVVDADSLLIETSQSIPVRRAPASPGV